MKNRFVVVDRDGLTSFNAKKEAAESFATMALAERRAHEIAESDPGCAVTIYEAVATVTADVSKPKTVRVKS